MLMLKLREDSHRSMSLPAAPVAFLGAIMVLLAGCPACVSVAAGGPAARPRFADYRFDFSLVDDTVIPQQQLWLRTAQTNITDHEVPKLDIAAGGPIFRVALVDSAGAPSRVGLPHDDGWGMFSKGILKPGETDVRYYSFGPAVWFFTPESLQATLVGHTWGLAIQFSTYVFGEADSLRMKRPPLPLTVIEATGPEVEATALLKKAMAAVHAGTPEEWRAACRELLQRFPQSRLADEALAVLHFITKPLEQLEVAREQARMNQGSPQLISWATEIKLALGVAQYNSFLAELAKNHPKARALEVLKEEK
jgi:hypothetical protein